MKPFLRRFGFVLILLAAAGMVWLLTALGPKPVARELETLPPEVRVMTVQLAPYRVTVSADGSVEPARRTTVTAGVAGRILWAAAGLRRGVRVARDAPLFRVEPAAYEQALRQAESRVAEAELRRVTERAAAEIARAEWEEEPGDPDPLALRIPQRAAAEAALAAARAALRRAERDLESTEIRAPHDGLVGMRAAEVGEWAAPGLPLVELLSVAAAEVRVSLPDAALGLLDLPFGAVPTRSAPRARLTAVLGGPGAQAPWSWEGRLVRMEGEVDPATRFLPAVIEVRDPYAPGPAGRPPLAAGMFMRAEIAGKEFPGVAVVPESAFREDGQLLLVDGENRLRIREVDDFWYDGAGGVLVRSGLTDGDRVVITPPAIVSDGMPVRVLPPGTASPAAGTDAPLSGLGDRVPSSTAAGPYRPGSVPPE